jgi:uncharacterized coiled-coil DUF342 family protein
VTYQNLTLNGLLFTGADTPSVSWNLQPGLNVLYGASNAGKSFAVKTIDFLLGSSRPLPDISERSRFDRAWLAINGPVSGDVTLMRALAGGALELHGGDIDLIRQRKSNGRHLSARHDHASPDNVSQFLLNEIGLGSKFVAIDINGKKRSLSFRDLARFCITDETAIQAETSPVESGQYATSTAERSVFKLLTTGVDDSAIVPVLDRKSFRTSTAAKLEVLDEMLGAVNEELVADYSQADELPAQYERIERTWATAQEQLQLAQQSIRALLARKREIAQAITRFEQRREQIAINLGRFEQLEDVYRSDIERLEAIEEVGFLLTLGNNKDCPLCGAPVDAQKHVHSLHDIQNATEAAKIEIDKIDRQRVDLAETIENLNAVGVQTQAKLADLDDELQSVETRLNQLAPTANEAELQLAELMSVRDQVRHGLTLLEQRKTLSLRRNELSALKPTPKAERPRLGVPTSISHDFAQVVSRVLEAWEFPGNRHVSFDDATHDLRIDGKNRRDNGKGVRAITHAAFKVALLLFCQERDLSHPGFVILDTPLLTYRDPIHSDAGELSQDEQELANTSLKDFFYEHLAEVGSSKQFIVVENVDVPTSIASSANIERFTGDPTTGRAGLF